MQNKMPLIHQRAEVLLEGIAVASGQAYRFGHGDPTMVAREVNNL
jgi:hypothetical protein